MTDEMIEYISVLAKLALSEEERRQADSDMTKMLSYIDKLKELDTEGVIPMSHIFPDNNVFREDQITNGDGSQKALCNAPACKDGMFLVPPTL